MSGRRIHELPNAAGFNKDLAIPVDWIDGSGETMRLNGQQLIDRFGHVEIPRLNVALYKGIKVPSVLDEEAFYYSSPQVAVSYRDTATSRWKEFEPQIWLFRYKSGRKKTNPGGAAFMTPGKFVHPTDVERWGADNDYRPQFHSGASSYLFYNGVGEDFDKIPIPRKTEFGIPDAPGVEQRLNDLDFLQWFSYTETRQIAQTNNLPFVWRSADADNVPRRLLPTSKRGSRRHAKRFACYFQLAIVIKVEDQADTTKYGWLIGPPSPIIKVYPRIEPIEFLGGVYCTGVVAEVKAAVW